MPQHMTPMSDARRWLAVAVAVGSVMVAVIDGTILNLALPSLVRDLGASNSDLQWIVDAYVLVFAGFMLTGGSLADRFGRVRMMRIGMTLFGLGSLVASFTDTVGGLTAARAVMGIGAAIISPATLSIVTSLFDDQAGRAKAIGIWAGGSMAGIVIGPIAGGLLLSHFWWGSVFLVNLPIVAISVPLLGALVPESKNPGAARLDVVGMVLSTAALATVLWATISAPEHGWTSVTTLGTYAAGALLLVVFVAFELRNPLPLLDVRFFAERSFVVPTIVCTAVIFMTSGFSFVLTQLLQFVHGYTPIQAGVRMLPMAFVLISGSVLAPRLADRFGVRRIIVLGLLLQGGGGVLLTRPGPHGAYLVLMIGMVVHGAGQAIGFSPATALAMASVQKERSGVAAGTNATARMSGSALGVAVVGSILVSAYGSDLRSHIAGLGLPSAVAARAQESIGSALGEGAKLSGAAGSGLASAARESFVVGASQALMVNAGLCIVAATVFAFLARIPAATKLPSDRHALVGE